MNLAFAWPLPPHSTLPTVLAALTTLLERHEGLRTVFTGEPGSWRQDVRNEGHLAVTVVDAVSEKADEAVSKAVSAVAEPIFGFAGEPSLRVAVVTSDGRPYRLVLCLSHLICDNASLAVLLEDFDELVGGAPAKEPAPVHQPLDQAEFEQSPAGQRVASRALSHFEKVLRRTPQSMLPRPARAFDGPRFRYLQFRSRALWAAVDVLAHRLGVSSTAVLHAGLASVSAHVAGLDEALLQIIASTRTDSRTRRALGPYSQSVPLCVDLREASMADAIRRSAGALIGALLHSRHREADMTALRRRSEAERGVLLDMSCWINDRHTDASLGRGSSAGIRAAELRTLADTTSWEWIAGDEQSTSTYFVHVDTEPGRELMFTALVDTSLLPGDEMIDWLRAVESLLVAAVHREFGTAEVGEVTGLQPYPRPRHWLHVDSSWIDPERVAALVRRTSGVRHVDVGLQDGRLLARLRPEPGQRIETASLRRACFEAMDEPRLIAVPAEFVVAAGH
jgi:hypothetical protein